MRPAAPPRPLPPRRGRASVTLGLASLVVSLLVVNGAFLFWPGFDLSPDVVPEVPPAAEALVLEVVEPTRQPPPPAVLPPAPPPPSVSELPPVEVPDDQIIEDVIEDMTLPTPPVRRPRPSAPRAPAPVAPPGPPAPPAPSAPGPATDQIVERPERSPRLVRASLPVYPPEARREGVRARAAVRVLISEGGQVLEATVTERVLLDGRDRETIVPTLPHGLEAAALEAAQRHLFRPARDDGQRVRAYATISLSFDPPR